MALIQCPECKKEVSDRCGRCPHCGFPVEKHFQQIERENAAAKKSVAAKEKAAAKERAAAEKEEKETVPFAKGFWRRAWIIAVATLVAFILSAVLSAGGAILSVGYAKFFVPPTYTATAKVHITAKTSNDGNITSSDLTVSKELIESCKVIAESESTLRDVCDYVDYYADLHYSYKELEDMVSIDAVNETSILTIRVDAHDPIDAALIADAFCDVLPKRIATILEGTTVKVVDYATITTSNGSQYLVMGAVPGVAVGVLVIAASFVIVTVIASRKCKKKNT